MFISTITHIKYIHRRDSRFYCQRNYENNKESGNRIHYEGTAEDQCKALVFKDGLCIKGGAHKMTNYLNGKVKDHF